MRNPVPPTELLIATRQFTRQLRETAEKKGAISAEYGRSVKYSRSVECYRGFLRNHIRGVLQTAFPLLDGKLTEDQRSTLIEQFISLHDAQEPEFHQIANELIYFLQQKPWLTDELQKIMEYEWLLYDCEIADSQVPQPSDTPLQPTTILRINPTLQNIRLPWPVTQQGPTWTQSGDYLYAIYRNAQHEVLRQALGLWDIAIIEPIDKGEACRLAELGQQLTLSPERLHAWILWNRKNGLIWTEEH
ncbi:HvfC/BufC family peptide modification chaperone [Yersinia mollaretii]|uniref:HvfC/BufC family peptide modification chaperone n=1 Tax=Yersinia mollaretii TaxID=33060 RepID=UPI0011AA8D76|nr:putative DNA-binding domain-containing protein [Yersinia mollaretii]MDN0111456.1 putative DNA-binding domain-containing protein [Yersinia mollaretii]